MSQTFELAQCFASSRVRKRFLKQMIPLRNLLKAYGLESFLVMGNTMLHIKRHEMGVVVALGAGECRYREMDPIFCVCPLHDTVDHIVRVNQLSGVIYILVRWGVLGENEILDDKVEQAEDEGQICCDNCKNQQMLRERFKQCKLCNDRERVENEPGFNGFYCSKQCQIAHWSEHKRMFHR